MRLPHIMIRLIVSLDEEDKQWLDKYSKSEDISMAEVVRTAIRTYRKRHPASSEMGELLVKTQGIWDKGDGLKYQKRLRSE